MYQVWLTSPNQHFCSPSPLVSSTSSLEARTTKEDVEDASGEGKQECWFGGGCLESSEMESGSWRDCCQRGVNMATPIYGDKPDQYWIMMMIICIKFKKSKLTRLQTKKQHCLHIEYSTNNNHQLAYKTKIIY